MRLSLAPVRAAATALLVAGAVLAVASPADAQQMPSSAAEARAMMQTNPALARQLREYLIGSGMTPSQIRQRLQAMGYSDALLDPLIRGGSSDASLDSLALSTDVIEAMVALGIADEAAVNSADAAVPRPNADSAAISQSLSATIPEGEQRAQAVRSLMRVREDSGFTVFGMELFRRGTTQFEPNLAGPVDGSYRLGPGDQMVLILTGDTEKAFTLTVTREGFVVVPQAGQVHVANLTMEQLEPVLRSRLRSAYSGLARGTTQMSVSIARLRSNQVLVIGEVEQPGSYRISSLGTALTALYAAGGPARTGNLRRIQVRRGGRTADTLDLYDYLLTGDASGDPRLQNGDVLFVPTHGPRVRVAGEVIRPATYELEAGETLVDVIAAAGGFTDQAALRRVQLERILPPAERARAGETRAGERVTVEVQLLEDGRVPSLPMQSGDVVRVFGIPAPVHRRVTVAGNVWTPGTVGFTPGMRLSEALRLAGGVRPDLFEGQVLVSRLRGDSTRVQLRTAFRDSIGTPVEDLVLQDADEIRTFSNTELRPRQYVHIVGAVTRPGRYAYRVGMTLRDLVLLSGGVKDGAHLGEAEIASRPVRPGSGAIATAARVRLDSSVVFGTPGNVALSGASATGPDTPLKPFDNVLIMAEPDATTLPTVTLTGEVRRPGVYTLRSKDERLADVIERAGGLTENAHVDGVFFHRDNGVGRIGVALDRALRDRGHRDNLVLQSGDSVHVPLVNLVVQVQGAVGAPRAVAYAPGQPIGYYVMAAGGAAPKADLGRAYVVQPNGKVEPVVRRRLLPDSEPTPRAGAVITVPARETLSRAENVAYITATAQLLAGLATIIAILVR